MEHKIMDALCKQYEVINPFDTEQGLNEKYGVPSYYEKPLLPLAHDIVKVDFEMLSACDEYFGWFPKGITMVGTVIEMCWACKQGKPVTTLCYKPNPFLLVYSDRFFSSYEDLANNKPAWVRDNPKDLNAPYYLGFKQVSSSFTGGETKGED